VDADLVKEVVLTTNVALMVAEHEQAPVDTDKETVLTTNMSLTEPEQEFFRIEWFFCSL